LVTLVRKQAKQIAEENNFALVIIDGAPGIGCPVIASITGADLVLVVTEPTLSGIHDLERVLGLAHHFQIPAAVCINKYDLNLAMTQKIDSFCEQQEIKLLGKIPYDTAVTKAQLMQASVVEYSGAPVAQEIKKLWRHLQYVLG
jgi:MinD superfamily P-loop ATPase